MTLSNFDWTDKDSLKWFIMLPTGHEGPYSLKQLISLKNQKKIATDVKIWAEGLPEPVLLKQILEIPAPTPPELPVDEVPDLPPLPKDEVPPIPLPQEELIEAEVEEKIPTTLKEPSPKKKSFALPVWGFLTVSVLLMGYFAFSSLIREHEKTTIRRLPKMSVELHERILQENPFAGWGKKIFFKEYLPDDHGQIWLVTSGFQNCEVEASFKSLDGKLLTMNDEKVSFKSKGKLSGHVAEFSSFDFTSGNKIIPGLYEMDVKASNCEWDSILSKVMNKFSPPEKEYIGRVKMVLFSKGAAEFTKVLDRIIQKKMEIELREQNQKDIFWQDLQQKFETLQAITLQIEQHVLDFLQNDPRQFSKNLKPMVDAYTRQYGSFLTSFVVENENYFKTLPADTQGDSRKRNYELLVKLTSKKIGFESMKFIEEFQGIKRRMRAKDLKSLQERVKKVYALIKSEINEKIIRVSEDRSK